MDNKLFDWSHLGGSESSLPRGYSKPLKGVFEEVGTNFSTQLGRYVSERKERLVIAGGNYSSLFFFPRLLGLFSKYDKRFKVELKLFEPGSKTDLKGVDFDILISAEYSRKRRIDLKGYLDMGYQVSDVFMEDYCYLGAAKSAIEKYGSIQGVLNNLPLLVARSVVSSDKNKAFNWNFKPKGREDEQPRIISDQFFLSYQMMKLGYGIWLKIDSMCDPGIIKIEDKPRLSIYRYVVYRDKKYQPLVDKMIKIIRRIR